MNPYHDSLKEQPEPMERAAAVGAFVAKVIVWPFAWIIFAVSWVLVPVLALAGLLVGLVEGVYFRIQTWKNQKGME